MIIANMGFKNGKRRTEIIKSSERCKANDC